MPAKRKHESVELSPERPALTPEAREVQLIALATNLAEQQLRDGTASAQVITHYLKLATDQNRIENEKLRHEVELLKAKTKALESEQHREELYANAIAAMRDYAGA